MMPAEPYFRSRVSIGSSFNGSGRRAEMRGRVVARRKGEEAGFVDKVGAVQDSARDIEKCMAKSVTLVASSGHADIVLTVISRGSVPSDTTTQRSRSFRRMANVSGVFGRCLRQAPNRRLRKRLCRFCPDLSLEHVVGGSQESLSRRDRVDRSEPREDCCSAIAAQAHRTRTASRERPRRGVRPACAGHGGSEIASRLRAMLP